VRSGEQRKHRSGKCDSEQARTKQDKTGHGHSEETEGSEFFTHGTPLTAREIRFVMRVKPMWVRNPPTPLNSVLEAKSGLFEFETASIVRPQADLENSGPAAVNAIRTKGHLRVPQRASIHSGYVPYLRRSPVRALLLAAQD
jgi:hypothetical protein